ncbi:hypothetical protein BGZ93_008626, partial [Podila epicladia]
MDADPSNTSPLYPLQQQKQEQDQDHQQPEPDVNSFSLNSSSVTRKGRSQPHKEETTYQLQDDTHQPLEQVQGQEPLQQHQQSSHAQREGQTGQVINPLRSGSSAESVPAILDPQPPVLDPPLPTLPISLDTHSSTTTALTSPVRQRFLAPHPPPPSSPLQPRHMSHSELHSEEHPPSNTSTTSTRHGHHSSVHSPHPLLTRLSSLARSRSSHLDRVHNLHTEIADIPSPAGGPSSASPSTWSISSSDTGPSSANSSVIESRIRYERLPNGSHRHHLSAPKRQQFLSNQVRRLRELLDGKREREDSQTASHHHLHPEVFEHPLSLLNEKYQNMETEQNCQGAASPSLQRRNTVKKGFVTKYGELQQVIGK